eukprot:3200202-Amphidinium_carterae.1
MERKIDDTAPHCGCAFLAGRSLEYVKHCQDVCVSQVKLEATSAPQSFPRIRHQLRHAESLLELLHRPSDMAALWWWMRRAACSGSRMPDVMAGHMCDGYQ